MNLTHKDITSCTILKSSREGELMELTTLGGLHLIMLKRPNGEVEMLSSSTSSLRSQAIANKKYPHLEVPVIVKSAEKQWTPHNPEIGKTRSGKSVLKNTPANDKHYDNFDASDHFDAADAHNKKTKEYNKKSKKSGSSVDVHSSEHHAKLANDHRRAFEYPKEKYGRPHEGPLSKPDSSKHKESHAGLQHALSHAKPEIGIVRKPSEKLNSMFEDVILKSGENLSSKAHAATFNTKVDNSYESHAKASEAHFTAASHHSKLANRGHEKAAKSYGAWDGKPVSKTTKQHEELSKMHYTQGHLHKERAAALKPKGHDDEVTAKSGPPTGMKTKSAEGKLVYGSSEKKPSPKAQAHNNLSDAKHSLLTAKQKIGKLISKPKTMKLGEDEATRKVDTLSTQRAVRRNQSKLQKQKPSYAKRPTPPSSGEMSQEVTRKLKSAEFLEETLLLKSKPSLIITRKPHPSSDKHTVITVHSRGKAWHSVSADPVPSNEEVHEQFKDKNLRKRYYTPGEHRS